MAIRCFYLALYHSVCLLSSDILSSTLALLKCSIISCYMHFLRNSNMLQWDPSNSDCIVSSAHISINFCISCFCQVTILNAQPPSNKIIWKALIIIIPGLLALQCLHFSMTHINPSQPTWFYGARPDTGWHNWIEIIASCARLKPSLSISVNRVMDGKEVFSCRFSTIKKVRIPIITSPDSADALGSCKSTSWVLIKRSILVKYTYI